MGSEAKFKVGDRVRRTADKHIGMEVDDTATVKHVDGYGGVELNEFSGTHAAYNLELVTPKPTFKVGDRVRITETEMDRGEVGDSGNVIAVGDEYVTVEFDPPFYGWGENGRCWNFFNPQSQLEHAPLTIEAGKFYTTRDGRRVGPILREEGPVVAPWKWRVEHPKYLDGTRAAWKANGAFDYGNKPHPADLIAEAPAYTANAAAQVDNQADDYGGGKRADSNLSVTITADTSELDAEIDRVKKRLKKLAKRARKLGISLDYSDLREAA